MVGVLVCMNDVFMFVFMYVCIYSYIRMRTGVYDNSSCYYECFLSASDCEECLKSGVCVCVCVFACSNSQLYAR